jgi:hypothetical protein
MALDHFPEREARHNRDWVRLKVVAQLSPGDEDNVQELLDLRVTCLGVGQNITNEVDQTLDLEGVAFLLQFHHDGGTHHLSGGCNVQYEWFLVSW